MNCTPFLTTSRHSSGSIVTVSYIFFSKIMDLLKNTFNFFKSPSAYYKDSIYCYFWHLDVISAIFGLKKVHFTRLGIVPITTYLKVWSVVVLVPIMLTQPIYRIWENHSFELNLLFMCDFSVRISNTLIQFVNSFYYAHTNAFLYVTMDSISKDFKLDYYDKHIGAFFYKNYLFFGISLVPFLVLMITESYFLVPVYSYIFRIPGTIQMFHFVIHVSIITSFLRIINSRLIILWPEESLDQKSIQSAEKSIFGTLFLNQHRFDVSALMDFYDRLANCADLLGSIHRLQFMVFIWSAFATSVINITFIALNIGPPNAVAGAVCLENLGSLLCACCVCDILRQEVQKTDLLVIRHLIRLKSEAAVTEKLTLFKQLVEKRQMRFSGFGLFSVDYSLLLTLIVSAITYAVVAIQMLSPRN